MCLVGLLGELFEDGAVNLKRRTSSLLLSVVVNLKQWTELGTPNSKYQNSWNSLSSKMDASENSPSDIVHLDMDEDGAEGDGIEGEPSSAQSLEVFLIEHSIIKAMESPDLFMSSMGYMMKEKFDDYWLDHNLILAIAVVMDPIFKIHFVQYAYQELYGPKSREFDLVRTRLFDIFDWYMKNFSTPATTTSSQIHTRTESDIHITRHGNNVLKDIKLFESEEFESTIQKSQLELYLVEPKMKVRDKLNVLDFWKSNQFRHPELARMARDILAIPISTVASEAAFSVGGRVVDQFRSALLPQNVKSLVCRNDWLFKSKDTLAPTYEKLAEDMMKDLRRHTHSAQASNSLNYVT